MIDNNPQLGSMLMNVADIAPKAATAQPSRGGGAFGEALAGARSVHDLRESRESAAPSRRDWARSDRTGDKPIGQDRAREVRSDAAGRAHDTERTDRAEHAEQVTHEDDAAAPDGSTTSTSDAAGATGDAETTSASTTTSDAEPTPDATPDGDAAQDGAAPVAVAAAPATVDLDAIVVPTTTTATQGSTTAVDAAIRMAISTDTSATATAATAAQAAAAGEQQVDGEVQELVATATQGAEDAADGDVQAGPKSPSASRSSAASGPSPVQLAAATFVDGEEVVVGVQQQAAATQATTTATAATTQVAEGDGGDADAQLLQVAASVDTDAEVDPDAPAAGPARSAKAASAPGQAIAAAATEAARTEDADVPEAVQAARLNQQQPPTVAAAAQHQAAVQAKAAEAAAEEGGDDAAPKLQPLPAQASPTATVARGEQVVPGIRVREGLLDATQQQRIDDIARQLATRLKLSHAAGGSQVQLSLKPRELGDVTVQMQVREGVVAATVLVDKADTVRLLQTNLDELRRSLEQQGLSVQQFSVDVRGEAGAGGANARAAADLHRNATRTSGGSASSVAGAAAVMPGYDGDDAVTAEDVHDGDVSVLA